MPTQPQKDRKVNSNPFKMNKYTGTFSEEPAKSMVVLNDEIVNKKTDQICLKTPNLVKVSIKDNGGSQGHGV